MRRRHVLLAASAPLCLTSSRAGAASRLDRSGLVLSFAEEFDDPISIYDPRSGTGRWKTNYDFGWQEAGPSSRVLKDELQVYSDSTYNGVNPFERQEGRLSITAARNPSTSDSTSDGRPYTSGLITTSKSFRQLYGFFEMRAALPQGRGLWPAFWLAVPLNPAISAPQFPGEIDVMEMLGRDPTTVYCSAHWPLDSQASRKNFKTISVAAGDTAQFRSYGVLWRKQSLTWFIDDAEVAYMPNPGLHRPMMILANLAVGGSWGGEPDAKTRFPASMVIEYIRAYR